MSVFSDFIRVEHLSRTVLSGDNTITILKDVSLKIKQGESVAIQGASGSGKTTLLTLLAGLDLPTTGEIFFLEHHLNRLSQEKRTEIRGQYMGFIFQSFQLLDTLTALQNVMLPLEIHYVEDRKAREEAEKWLTRVGLHERLHHYPKTMSGGEQQRVAIARAFVNHPPVIFADEMTGS